MILPSGNRAYNRHTAPRRPLHSLNKFHFYFHLYIWISISTEYVSRMWLTDICIAYLHWRYARLRFQYPGLNNNTLKCHFIKWVNKCTHAEVKLFWLSILIYTLDIIKVYNYFFVVYFYCINNLIRFLYSLCTVLQNIECRYF